jgi:hypothetical protein
MTSPLHRTRREFLTTSASGLGGIALGSMLSEDGLLNAANAADPAAFAEARSHREGAAKACIFIFMEGAPSQLDLFTPKPAFVVTALLGAWTAWSLAKERVSLNSARWLPVAYVFAYLAYQRIDQLVPQAVRDAYGRLKESLGYSTGPRPPSYGSVSAALFVIGVGLLSLRC